MTPSNVAASRSRKANFAPRTVDLATTSLRELNQALHQIQDANEEPFWEVLHPKGSHAVAAGVDKAVTIDVRGSVGYYCGGMNDGGEITVHGSAGPGGGGKKMLGKNVVPGDARHYVGAPRRGGEFGGEGKASPRGRSS